MKLVMIVLRICGHFLILLLDVFLERRSQHDLHVCIPRLYIFLTNKHSEMLSCRFSLDYSSTSREYCS